MDFLPVITGGEPTLPPDIEELVERERFECKFRSLLLISNGTLLDRKPLILRSVTGLVVSLEDFRVRVLEIKLKVFGHERRLPHQPAQWLPLRRRPLVERAHGHEIRLSLVHLGPSSAYSTARSHARKQQRRGKHATPRSNSYLLYLSPALIRKNHSYGAMPLLCSRIDAHDISAQTHGL